ncbi:hypothetical protein TNCV_2949471 [Trichonephila clavipes]|nr:hypothetical protein TNCV_2949471 [Trichonephila clavipes]
MTPDIINSIRYQLTLYSNSAEGRIETFTSGLPHTYTIAINVQIESGFVVDSIQSRSNPFELDKTPKQRRL